MTVIDAPLIFPIGHYLGASFRPGAVEPDGRILRIGWDIYRLDDDAQLGVWALAHGVPGGTDTAPWTRATTEGAARASGFADAASVLDELLAKDLLVEITPGTSDAIEFAQVTRLRSLLLGLGNTPDDRRRYGIGLTAAHPTVRVPLFTYELWKWGHACDSLWHAVQIMARAGRDAGSDDQQDIDPEGILTRCLAALQVLIGHGAAYLDEAREEWDQRSDVADLEPAAG
jgi:hypothetical protein